MGGGKKTDIPVEPPRPLSITPDHGSYTDGKKIERAAPRQHDNGPQPSYPAPHPHEFDNGPHLPEPRATGKAPVVPPYVPHPADTSGPPDSQAWNDKHGMSQVDELSRRTLLTNLKNCLCHQRS